MKTEEAIEFLEVEIKCLEKEIEICNPNDDIDIQVIEANKNIIIKYNQVIILLQQGEKYKKYKLMWEEISQGRYALIEFDNEGYEKKGTKKFNEIEQKYFPKGDD